jgi:uncharacterized protein YbjT (DUF2867 family)
LIAAAQAADVPRLIYVSFSGHIDLDFPLRNAKRAVERRLRDSGLIYTILRPSYFMETWLSPAAGFDYRNARVRVYGEGRRPISWISRQDVAQFTVESVENPAARYATFEVGGPDALSLMVAVRAFEEAGGQAFEAEHVPEEALHEAWQVATDPMERSLAGLRLSFALGDTIDMRSTLEAFPLRLTSVRDYAQQVLAA